MISPPLSLAALLPEMADDAARQLEVFALLTLGVLDAIESGVLFRVGPSAIFHGSELHVRSAFARAC